MFESKTEVLVLVGCVAAAGLFGFQAGSDAKISSLVEDRCKSRIEVKKKENFLYSNLEAQSDYQGCVLYWTIERKGEKK